MARIDVSGGGQALNDALQTAVSGDNIYVDDGVYAPISINNSLHTTNQTINIIAKNGLGNAIIDGNNEQRCITWHSWWTGFQVFNMVLRNGYASDGQGGGQYGGCIVNSEILNCSAASYGGACSACNCYGNIIDGCSASNGGGCYNALVAKCEIKNCTATNYGSACYQCQVHHCNIHHNHSGIQDAMHQCQRICDCLIHHNTSVRYTAGVFMGGTAAVGCVNNVIYANTNTTSSDAYQELTIQQGAAPTVLVANNIIGIGGFKGDYNKSQIVLLRKGGVFRNNIVNGRLCVDVSYEGMDVENEHAANKVGMDPMVTAMTETNPDLHLLPGSPAIHAGTPDAESVYQKTNQWNTYTDSDGSAWKATPSIGMYEYEGERQETVPNETLPIGMIDAPFREVNMIKSGPGLVVNGGIASGFTADSCLYSGHVFSPGNKRWKWTTRFKRGGSTLSGQIAGVFGGYALLAYSGKNDGCAPFYVSGNNLVTFLSSTGTSWDIANATIVTTALLEDGWIYAECEYTGSKYEYRVSKNGGPLQLVKVIDNAKPVFPGTEPQIGTNRGYNSPYVGEIDLNYCNIYIEDKLEWSAMRTTTKSGDKPGGKGGILPYTSRLEYLIVPDGVKASIKTGITAGNGYLGFDLEVLQKANSTGGRYPVAFSKNGSPSNYQNRILLYTDTQGSDQVCHEMGTGFWKTYPGFPVRITVEKQLYHTSEMSGTQRELELFTESSGTDRSLPLKFYWFKVWAADGTTLVRDFIPVRVNELVCLYDKVTGQIFKNGFIGDNTALIGGPDIKEAISTSSDQYVQDGLIFHFDGIENNGRGLHTNSPTTDGVVELVTGTRFTFQRTNNWGYVNATDRSLVMRGAQMNGVGTDLNAKIKEYGSNPYRTIELVGKSRKIGDSSGNGMWVTFHDVYGDGQTIATESNARILMAYANTNHQTPDVMVYPYQTSGITYSVGTIPSTTDDMLARVSVVASPTTGTVRYRALNYLDGLNQFLSDGTTDGTDSANNPGSRQFSNDAYAVLGGMTLTGSGSSLQTELCAVRIYNRILTTAEQRHNLELDIARFGMDRSVNVPSDEQFVGYIETTASKASDTGIRVKSPMIVEMDVEPVANTADRSLFGFYKNPGRMFINSGTGGKWAFGYDDSWLVSDDLMAVGRRVKLRAEFTAPTCNLYLDNVLIKQGTNKTDILEPMQRLALFGGWAYNSTYYKQGSGTYLPIRLYGCKIWTVYNGEQMLLADYKPALNDDGQATVYDMVTRQFLPPPDSGNATYGMDVSVTFDELAGQGAYIPDDWEYPKYFAGKIFGRLPTPKHPTKFFATWLLNGEPVDENSVVPTGGCTLTASYIDYTVKNFLELTNDAESKHLAIGINPDVDVEVEMDVAFTDYTGSCHFGSGGDWRIFCPSGYNRFMFDWDTSQRLQPTFSDFGFKLNRRYVIGAGNHWVENKSAGVHFNHTTTSSYVPTTGNLGFWGYIRIYKCKVWKDGVLVRHLIPITANSSVGLYDCVNAQTYMVNSSATWKVG